METLWLSTMKENEITRCVVEEWIENNNDDFYKKHYSTVALASLLKLKDVVDNFGIIKPYSLVLEDEEGENIAELYVADGDTIIVGDELLPGLEEDLDEFLKKLIP